ncbi:MAG: BolA family transcriptional regulator [Deltaproteobacteria bacterium]|nr:BolA family transcriptional regulator [Deltaproteobacteria bacterium]
MFIQKQIESKLAEGLKPAHLEVINESPMHGVPPGSESHFKVVVVSSLFEGKSLVQRHRMINEVLAQELKESVHALTMQTLTPDEWTKKGGRGTSPPCLGGSKAG